VGAGGDSRARRDGAGAGNDVGCRCKTKGQREGCKRQKEEDRKRIATKLRLGATLERFLNLNWQREGRGQRVEAKASSSKRDGQRGVINLLSELARAVEL
jgi:hypothetical protein